jgi:ABC-type Fe3+/spermidine/putrescine transport system ATPase subunit
MKRSQLDPDMLTGANHIDQPAVAVRLDGVTKRFGDLTAVDDVSIAIPGGSFFSLLGPSGCGKSTTLRIVSGFEQPDSGRVMIGGEDVTSMEARKRPTAMVFQNYALFPHMTVGENVAYGLKVRRMSISEIRKVVTDSLKSVDMESFVDTPVTSLSGGQQQRTALARAVAIEPKVILFDEPLSNLDVALRRQTRGELKKLQHRLGLTSIYVTHDQEEALALSDSIALMRDGKIVQMGSPEELYAFPKSAFVASFLGGSNIVSSESHIRRFSGADVKSGEVLSIRPEHVVPSSDGPHQARVIDRQFLGMITELTLEVDGVELKARVSGTVEDASELRFDITHSRPVMRDDH